MKKIILFVIAAMLLCGCSSTDSEDMSEEKLRIAVPSGAPSLAFYNEMSNDEFMTGDAKAILPELAGEGGSDIIVIDTVNGVKALNNGARYKLAATITFGNFYIAATGYDDDGIMNEGDYIVIFSQGATPDLVFHYIYGDIFDSNIHYVNAVSDATPCLLKGINIYDDERTADEEPYVDYVMIAEPALSAAKAQKSDISVYANIQDEYAKKSNGLDMVQASVFVSDRLDHDRAIEFLNGLEEDINRLIEDPELFAKTCEENGLADEEIKDVFGVPNAKLATAALKDDAIGLGFVKAIDHKNAIDKFVKIFGMERTNEEIYFQ